MALSIQTPAIPTHTLQTQGIEGVARRPVGNRMPSPHHKLGPPAGIKTTICIFTLTKEDQTTRTGKTGCYSAIHSRLIRQAETDDSGRFRIELPPGIYSVFTRKDNLFYATRRDEKNNIAPVEVLPGKMTRVECNVESDHGTVY